MPDALLARVDFGAKVLRLATCHRPSAFCNFGARMLRYCADCVARFHDGQRSNGQPVPQHRSRDLHSPPARVRSCVRAVTPLPCA